MSSTTWAFCAVLLALACAAPVRADRPQLAQASPTLEVFDELEGLKSFGRPTPVPPQAADDGDDPSEDPSDDPTPDAAPPRAQGLARNPSPGDGFDELEGLKTFGQDWPTLAETGNTGQSAAEEASPPGPQQESVAAVETPARASDQSSATATVDRPADDEATLRLNEATPTEQETVGTTPAPKGFAVEELAPLLRNLKPDETAAAADGDGAATDQVQPPKSQLEQDIDQLFEPQPLGDQGLTVGALPKLDEEPQGAGDAPPSQSAVPKAEQEEILSQLEALNPVVATVGEEKIYWTDVTKTAKRLPERYQDRFETVFPVLLQRIVDLKLLAIAGREQGLDQDEEVRARVAAYEERLLGQTVVRRHLGETVTPEALRNRYNEIVQDRAAHTKISARHILLKTEDEALEVIAELDQGGDFVELAKSRSIGASAANGGSLGQFSIDRMVPAFSAAALALSPGTYTREPVLTQFGWHVILLEEGADARLPDYTGMEPDLRRDVSQRTVERLLRDLRAGAEIEFFPDPDLAVGSDAAGPAQDRATVLE